MPRCAFQKRKPKLSSSNNVFVLQLDVTEQTGIAKAVDESMKRFGTIDVLINNAGYGLTGVFESSTPAQIERQYAVNVFGVMNVTKAVLPVMRKNKSGTIINISSFGGITAGQFSSLYNSSKFAVEGFSEALSHELSFMNIAVKIIEPGSVSTNFRNGMELIKNEIKDYGEEFAALMTRYVKKTAHLQKTTVSDVAGTIYEAATDGKTKLRYVVGEDAQFYINLKMQNKEADFLKIMRE